MRNILKFLLVLACSTLFLYSCESAIESEVQSVAEELIVSAKENTLVIDSVELGGIEILKMTDELKALRERMDELKKTKTRASSNNYDQYFSTNMWAIRELPFGLKVRSSGSFLATQGRGKEVTIGRRLPRDFYVKIPSSMTGIPYLIYSDDTKTPLAVGYYTNNPNQKILLVMDNDNPNEISASWDIISATNNPGYYVIQSESYIGQGSSGSWWDIFNYVADVQGSYVGYNQYSQNATQEFAITPRATFKLKKLEFINSYSAIVTQKENISIQQATTNSSPQLKRENIEFNRIVEENSYFEEEKGIEFNVSVSDLMFARPTVTLGEIDLIPNNQIPADTKYEPGVRAVFERNLHQIVPVTVKPRTKLIMTYYYKVYDVSIDYVATIVYNDDREAKLPGRWSGKIYVDEIFEPDFEEINLDTQRSIKGKVNVKNATLSSPVTF